MAVWMIPLAAGRPCPAGSGRPARSARTPARLRSVATFYFAASFPTAAENCFQPPSTASDAAGAVDGVKNGRYGFHTNYEPNPWWQVDLGSPPADRQDRDLQPARLCPRSPQRRPPRDPCLRRRQDLDPGYENQGRSFGGINQGKPWWSTSGPAARRVGPLKARFVRIQMPSAAPIFLHFDEVEIYAPGDAAMQKNLPWDDRPIRAAAALGRGGGAGGAGQRQDRIGRHWAAAVVTLNGKPLPADRAKIARRERHDHASRSPLVRTATRPVFRTEVTPFHSQPIRWRPARVADRLAGTAEARFRQEPADAGTACGEAARLAASK